MALSRYQLIDAYTLEELQREYQNADAKGRIRLLKKFSRNDQVPPFEIVRLAREDPQVEVRQWIARHGKSLPEAWANSPAERYQRRTAGHGESLPETGLGNDPDPFVRACLRENPHVFGSIFFEDWKEYFHEATPLERLALVRNPNVNEELIEKIFDSDDKELDIDLAARMKLVCAFLTNTEFLTKQAIEAGLTGDPLTPTDSDIWTSGWSSHSAGKFLSTLWEYASKWPQEARYWLLYVYQYVPCPDETKAKIYQTVLTPQTEDKRPRQELEENEELKEDEERDE